METKLKPCPFCGGEAFVIEGEYSAWAPGYAVRCRNYCLIFGATGRFGEAYTWTCRYETEAEAIEAWNTRAERTCRVTESSYDELLDEVYTDLSCGHWTRLSEREVSYCPKCGAKIERTTNDNQR